MLTCKDASHLISEGQERKLRFSQRMALRMHLWMCNNCRRVERQIHFLRQAMKNLAQRIEADELQGPRLSLDARERISRRLSMMEKTRD